MNKTIFGICLGTVCVFQTTMTMAAPKSTADCLFDWADRTYPEIFSPATSASQSLDNYYYRYYSKTNSYLGIDKNTQHLVYAGPLASPAPLLDLGVVSQWITTAVCTATPLADAGADQRVIVGSLVTFDGSLSSESYGNSLQYAWLLTSKPVGSSATLASSKTLRPTLTADVVGTYIVSLVVNDGVLNSLGDSASVTTTAVPSIVLSQSSSSLFGGSDTVHTLPFSTNASSSASIQCIGSGCSTTFTVSTFKLKASGQSYTISNLNAINSTPGSTITPLFGGLTNGQVIPDGQTVSFTLRSPFTRNATVQLVYSFTIQETGKTFTYNVQLRTN